MKVWTREQRDTGFLIGVVALVMLPHLTRLPLWASALVMALLAWRGALAVRDLPLPRRWLLIALALSALVATRLTHGVLVGRSSGLTLCCVLLALKLLEMHARRDAFVVFFLGFFLVLTQFLHSQALWVAIWTLLCVFGLMTALVLVQMPLGQPRLRDAAREAARTTALGVPLMVLLFLLFPRIGPLWGLPGTVGSSGLSDEVSFGAVALLATDERIALRLRMLDGAPLPPPQDFYLRGPVLTEFDGQLWRPRAMPMSPPQALVIDNLRPQAYEMLLEPQRASVLPVLEHSPGEPGEAWRLETLTLTRTSELVWVAPRPINETLRVRQAWLPQARLRLGPLDEHASLIAARRLPRELNPRLTAWAQRLHTQAGSPAGLVQALLRHIREQPYRYTLAPGVYGERSPHGIDEFWFDGRAGFCEHYASAFVVALRAAGVPARLVTGYLGRDPELQDGWAVVRNSHAHAWAEVWLSGQGWLRVDPTAAVAPERVERGLPLVAPASAFRSMMDGIDPTLWLQLRRVAESLDLRWQQAVLGYQRERQFDLLQRLGFAQPDWSTLAYLGAGVIAALATLALAWQHWQQRSRSPWTQRLATVHGALARAGWSLPAHRAPLSWAHALQAQGASPALVQTLLALEAWRYGPQAVAEPRGWRGAWVTRWAWARWWRGFRAALQR